MCGILFIPVSPLSRDTDNSGICGFLQPRSASSGPHTFMLSVRLHWLVPPSLMGSLTMVFLGAAMGSLRLGTESVGTCEKVWQVGTAEAEQAAHGTFPTLSFPGF